MCKQFQGYTRAIFKGVVLIVLVIFTCTERASARSVPSSRSSSTVKLVRLQDLSFGGAISGLSPGTIVVDPSGLVVQSGGLVRKSQIGVSNAHPAQLSFTLFNPARIGTIDHVTTNEDEALRHESDDVLSNDVKTEFSRDGTNVSISLPQSSILESPGSSSPLVADHFTLLRTNGAISIGATLHVGPMQPVGVYSGSFDVTVICE